MSNLCIIPARGGSKRIPRKNIKDFLGKPIIAYSIEAAVCSGLFDEVMVSTEDPEIAEIARQYGANIPFMRSSENADDFAGTADVLIEVINRYQIVGTLFEYACCIYPTAPFITKELLQSAFVKMYNNNFDCVFPVLHFSSPIQRAMRLENDGTIKMIKPEFLQSRTQDLDISYHDAGQFYLFRVDFLLKAGKLMVGKSGAVFISDLMAQDIDNEIDWKLAELKYNLVHYGEMGS